MKERIVSIALAIALLAVLVATPTLAKESKTEIPDAVAQLAKENAAAAEEAKKKESSAPANTSQQEKSETEKTKNEKVRTLAFKDLRNTVESNNYMVRSLEYQLNDLRNTDLSSMEDMSAEMEEMKTSISSAKTSIDNIISRMEDMPAMDEDVLSVFKELSDMLGSVSDLMTALDGYLAGQAASAELNMKQGENSIQNGIDQIVKGAEALYVGIITMEAAEKDVQRGIDSLDRAVAIFEKQYELGMASAYDVESMKHQRSGVASQLESLRFQILTSKMMLEGLCSWEPTGTVQLGELTMPTKEELVKVDYKKTINQAQANNVDILNAELAYEYSPTTANSFSHDSAVTTFAYNYRIICLTVGEKERLVEAAAETVAFQERSFAIEAKEYELGMISYEEYMTAKNTLEQAKSDHFSAQLDLFTAYRNFVWARDCGIV